VGIEQREVTSGEESFHLELATFQIPENELSMFGRRDDDDRLPTSEAVTEEVRDRCAQTRAVAIKLYSVVARVSWD
jgi:hypothetical protein